MPVTEISHLFLPCEETLKSEYIDSSIKLKVKADRCYNGRYCTEKKVLISHFLVQEILGTFVNI